MLLQQSAVRPAFRRTCLSSISAWPPAGSRPVPWRPKRPLKKHWRNWVWRLSYTRWAVSATAMPNRWWSSTIRHQASPRFCTPMSVPGKPRCSPSCSWEGDPRFEHILGATRENDMIPWVMEFARFSMETRIVTRLCGHIDPECMDEYILERGYASLAHALEMQPGDVVGEDRLRRIARKGRGRVPDRTEVGSWLPALRRTRRQDRDLQCRRGRPRRLHGPAPFIESNPHQVIEGMAICAHAVGAEKPSCTYGPSTRWRCGS